MSPAIPTSPAYSSPGEELTIDARNTPIVFKHSKRQAVKDFGDKWQTICHES